MNKFLKEYSLQMSVVVTALVFVGAWIYTAGLKNRMEQETNTVSSQNKTSMSELEEKVLPSDGVILPIVWGNLGTKLISTGIIDENKFKAIYEQRGIFTDPLRQSPSEASEYKNLLLGENNGQLKITNENAGYILNLFWALGLANKNLILENGPMMDKQYGGAGNFASTGGWTLAKGNTMDHYSQHALITLTSEQQALVEKISKGVYRPCCGNSTYFPDCNHGMAMLALLELMASQNVSEQDMWKTALIVNSYWFPDTYLTIAIYMKEKGVDWKDVSPQEMLGADYSSAQGFRNIASQVVLPKQQQNECGI